MIIWRQDGDWVQGLCFHDGSHLSWTVKWKCNLFHSPERSWFCLGHLIRNVWRKWTVWLRCGNCYRIGFRDFGEFCSWTQKHPYRVQFVPIIPQIWSTWNTAISLWSDSLFFSKLSRSSATLPRRIPGKIQCQCLNIFSSFLKPGAAESLHLIGNVICMKQIFLRRLSEFLMALKRKSTCG